MKKKNKMPKKFIKFEKSGVIIWDNTDRIEYVEGIRYLEEQDFKRISISGLVPCINASETSIFIDIIIALIFEMKRKRQLIETVIIDFLSAFISIIGLIAIPLYFNFINNSEYGFC